MRDSIKKINKDTNSYTWIIGGLMLLLGDIGLSKNVIPSYYSPFIVITSLALILGPVFKEKWKL